MRMHADDTDNTDIDNNGLLYEKETFIIRGVLYSTHNEIGPYAREKQYCDVAERIFIEKKIPCIRELQVGDSGNRLDFVIYNKIPLEFKAKRLLTKEDYFQVQRYLQETGLNLAILVNFRDKYIKPRRILRIKNWQYKDQNYPHHPN